MKILNFWQKKKTKSLKKLLNTLSLLGFILIIYPYSTLEAQVKLNIKTKNDTVTVHLGDIGSDFPCSKRFGISLEDERYLFCKSSSMLATMAPDGVNFLLPDGTIIDSEGNVIAPKTAATPPNDNSKGFSYEAIFNRVNALKVGVIQSENSHQMGVLTTDLKEHYPNQVFDVVLDGQNETAFNPEALFYEMLVSIQKLSHDNAELKLRLSQIEAKMGIGNNGNSIKGNYLKVLTNPTNSKILELEYAIEENVENAKILISATSGKIMQTIAFEKRGVGYEYLSFDLPTGLYYCTLVIDDKLMETQKFVMQ